MQRCTVISPPPVPVRHCSSSTPKFSAHSVQCCPRLTLRVHGESSDARHTRGARLPGSAEPGGPGEARHSGVVDDVRGRTLAGTPVPLLSADDFVLKGGLLLASFGNRRPTVDADALARNMSSDQQSVARRVAEANTRVRDFVDVYVLTGMHTLECSGIREAIKATAGFRGVELTSLEEATRGLGALRSTTYTAYRRGLGAAGSDLPTQFDDTISATAAFIDPVIAGMDDRAEWHPVERGWMS